MNLAMLALNFDVNALGSLESFGLGSLVGGALVAVIVILSIIFLAVYAYKAWAWHTIAKKLKYKNYWLAWIPLANFFLLPILAKKRWEWGFIILIPFVFWPLILVPFLGITLLYLGVAFLGVMSVIWTWNIYEQRKYPGWLSLMPILMIIPIINIFAAIGELIVIGFVAWKDQEIKKIKKRK